MGLNHYFLRIELMLWIAWVISWVIAAAWRAKRTASAPRGTYRLQMITLVIGFYLLFLPIPGLVPLWQVSTAFGWAMVALVVAGIAFAWWARLAMGRLWSGGVETKEGHRVVQNGPFAVVRHPIYTGMIGAALAIALTSALPTALAGIVIFALGFVSKARVEERFLQAELGGYDEYRTHVPMLVPGLRPGLFGKGG